MDSLDTLPFQEMQLLPAANTAYRRSRTRLLNEIEQVMRTVAAWPGVVVHSNRDEVHFVAGESIVGELRWDGRLDVVVPAELRDRLLVEAMAASDPHPSRCDRVVWIVRTHDDVQRAIWLLRLACRSGEVRQTQTAFNDC